MCLVTIEIQNAIKSLNLQQSDIRLLDPLVSRPLYFDLLKSFVRGADRRWWWEDFVNSSESYTAGESIGYLSIPELVPDIMEQVWFMVEECDLDHYPIYETTPAIAALVIGECYGYEYYLIAKDRNWLLCENHHNRFIGLGKSVTAKIRSVR